MRYYSWKNFIPWLPWNHILLIFSWVCTWPLSAFINFLRRVSCIFKCWGPPPPQSFVLAYLLFFLSTLSWGISTRADHMLMIPKYIYIYICYRLLWNLDHLIQFLILCLLFVLSGTQTFKIFKQKHILDIPISPVLGHYLAVKAENLSAILTFPSLLLSNPVMTNLSVLSPTYF